MFNEIKNEIDVKIKDEDNEIFDLNITHIKSETEQYDGSYFYFILFNFY